MKNLLIQFLITFVALIVVSSLTTANGQCLTDADCNDNNLCTDDKCNAAGICENTPVPDCHLPFIEEKWELCSLPSLAANIILPAQLCPVTGDEVDIVKCAVVCDENDKDDIKRVSVLEFKPEFKRCEEAAIGPNGACNQVCPPGVSINRPECKECILRVCDKQGIKISEQELTPALPDHVCRFTAPVYDPEYNDRHGGKCTGTPNPNACDQYTLEQCPQIPGCQIVLINPQGDPNDPNNQKCSGTPLSCQSLSSHGQIKCETSGCDWTECEVYTGSFKVKAKDLGHYTVVVAAEDSVNGCFGVPEPDACRAYTPEQCRALAAANLGCKLDNRCEGTPALTCRQLGAGFGENKCLETKGCFVKGQCLGAFPCNQVPINQCGAPNNPGCRLIQAGGRQFCRGVSSCSQFENNEVACKAKRGCTFQKVCDGKPEENACEKYNLDQCRRIRGCSIKEGCTGTPQSCKAVGEKFGIQKCLETRGCNLTHSILQNQFELNICLQPVPKDLCGDSIVQPPEQCDPPGGLCQDAAGVIGICDGQCQCQTGGGGGPFCGNNVVEFPPETCDPPGSFCVDPFTGAPGICSQTCGCQPFINGNHFGVG